MRIKIIAADSMGVRSLATVVETSEGVIGIDLGASLAPRRYGLPPHDVELKRLEEALEEARKRLGEAEVVVITHYHYDHYMRHEPELYSGKILLAKNPSRDINRSQAIRAYVFFKKLGVLEKAKEVVWADGSVYRFGRVVVEVSPPVWHGAPGSRVGRVLMVRIIDEDGVVVFTSDVQGPADPAAVEILRSWSTPRPNVLIVGGPPTYFAGYKVPVKAVEAGLEGLATIIRDVRPRVLVVDHHLLRDIKYLEKIQSHIALAEDLGVRLVTAAEYEGRPVEQLEAKRRELWRKNSG